MRDIYGDIYYEALEDLLNEEKDKLESLIGKEILDVLAYTDDECTEWYQPIIFVIENINLLIEVYDLEKLVIKWNNSVEHIYYTDKLKWGNKNKKFKRLVNSKITRIDIIEFCRNCKVVYSKLNTNELDHQIYTRNLIGIGFHTETWYIEICNTIDDAEISFNYIERNDLKRYIIK